MADDNNQTQFKVTYKTASADDDGQRLDNYLANEPIMRIGK